MARHRVRPSDIASHRMNRRLASKRKYEVRVKLWSDQAELLHEWCDANNTTLTNVVCKLVNYWLHLREAKREQILKEY